jgi:SAM-dependent methyltransferase
MDAKSALRAVALELRHELEGRYVDGDWKAGDLERRLGEIGVWRNRSHPADEITYRLPEDRQARTVVDALIATRTTAGMTLEAAVVAIVRESAYTWANRLLALRCMEARGLIDEVILQKPAYGGRSLQHQRLARRHPERCAGEDEGLFAALFEEFERRVAELPLLFDPEAPMVALRPSVAALKRCLRLLSGTEAASGQDAATDETFTAPDALGWAYQYWNTEEKARVFANVRPPKRAKIQGADIIPATCIYTEPYIVQFLVQNSLGALWAGMRPDSALPKAWPYYVHGASRARVAPRPVREITFLDPTCGSGHFLVDAFDLFYAMYEEEGSLTDPAAICAAILEHNLFGIDIDARAIQIAALALFMRAREKAPGFTPRCINLVATDIHLPAAGKHVDVLLRKHPEDAPLKPALLAVFEGLGHADELGSLLQIEEPVDQELRHLQERQRERERKSASTDLFGPRTGEDWVAWKHGVVDRLRQHFAEQAQTTDLATAFFGQNASKGLSLADLLSRRYDIVAANPPYMGSKNMGPVVKQHVERRFAAGKRDLYAAFILRCLELAAEGGRVAMVTQQSWMFLRSYADLRALDAEKLAAAPRAFKGILREATIEALAHLGPRAFADIGGEVVNVALFVLARAVPGPDHRLTAFRLVGPKSPEEKGALLREAIDSLRSE